MSRTLTLIVLLLKVFQEVGVPNPGIASEQPASEPASDPLRTDTKSKMESPPSLKASRNPQTSVHCPTQTQPEVMRRFENSNQQCQKDEPVQKDVDSRIVHHINHAFANGINDKAIQDAIASRPSNCIVGRNGSSILRKNQITLPSYQSVTTT